MQICKVDFTIFCKKYTKKRLGSRSFMQEDLCQNTELKLVAEEDEADFAG